MRLRRSIALIFTLFLALTLTSVNVQAGQIFYEDFEFTLNISQQVDDPEPDFQVCAPSDSSNTDTYTIILSLENQYLTKFQPVFHYDVYGSQRFKVKVNGVLLYSEIKYSGEGYLTPTIYIPFQATGEVTIEIIITVNTGATGQTCAEYEEGNLTIANEPVVTSNSWEEPLYIPPGADGTSRGFLLNQSEYLLPETYNLSEGTISFWLKWDGTTNLEISDNIGIDSDGYLYVKNDTGATYTFTGASLPTNEYVPIYIGWEESEGYIMVNTTKLSLNWHGNLELSKIGDYSQSSSAIIDEFKIWDTYIPSDQIIYESQVETYYLRKSSGEVFPIQPEGDVSLGTITVTFLDNTSSFINSTTLSPGNRNTTIPDNAEYIVISRYNTERFYYIKNLTPSTLAFPSDGDVTLQIVTLTVYPTSYDILEIWTLDDKLATRVNITGKTSTTFTSLYGTHYKFIVYSGNTSVSTIRQVSSDTINLQFPEPEKIFQYQEAEEKLIVDKEDNIATITYVAPQPTTATLRIVGYDQNNRIVLNITDIITTTSHTRQVVMGDDISYLRVEVSSPSYSSVRIVQNSLNFSFLIPEYIFPNGLRIIFFGLIGIFLVSRKNKELSCLGAVIVLTIVDYIQLADVPSELLLILGIGAGAGLITASQEEEVSWL